MPPEPKKPMEQMLEALAKARRAQFGDDLKMPNPMRARLHEEIARPGATEDEKSESRPSWITMFWPRITVAAALATLIVIVPAIWWNQSHQVSGIAGVAMRERTAGAGGAMNNVASAEENLAKAHAVSVPEQTVNLADNSKINIEPSSEAEALKSQTHFAERRAATESASQGTKGFDKEIASANIQAAPAAAPADAGRDSKLKLEGMTAAAPPVAPLSSAANPATMQRFSQQSGAQSFRNNVQVNRTANVLNTFQVQQQGSDIRVVDADGSTYTGRIEQSTKNGELDSRISARGDAAAKQMPRYAAKSARENESVTPQSYFRATGYNVSLQKMVVFEGNYAAPPTQQPATASSKDRERTQQSHDRARIVGTVRVNGDAPVEVDAIAEAPEPAATKKSEK